jgi:methylmalonyl-CoA/ethylmalonyl-CoA epimerase
MSRQVNSIHHINFLVRDLDAAEASYRQLLGLSPAVRESLPARGVETARFRVGETWLVLVQPTSEEGEPARMLREQGEGFMLLSFAVDDLDAAIDAAGASGGRFAGDARDGLADWRIVDFEPEDTFGAQLQLCGERRGS